jgi:hypothetical protein
LSFPFAVNLISSEDEYYLESRNNSIEKGDTVEWPQKGAKRRKKAQKGAKELLVE